jgi:hypothetical protein
MYIVGLSIFRQARFARSRELTDIEDAILILQKQVQYMDDGHSDREEYLSILGANRISRFECLGEPYDIEDCIANLQMAVHLSKDDDPLLLLHHTRPQPSQRLLNLATY